MILIEARITLRCHTCLTNFTVVVTEDGGQWYKCPHCGEVGCLTLFRDSVVRHADVDEYYTTDVD